MFLSRTQRSRKLVLSFSPVDFSRLLVMLSFGPSAPLPASTVDHACYTCNTILSASSRSRLTLTSLLRPMSCIPHLILYMCLFISKFLPILSPPIVRCCVPLCDVLKKYIIPPWLSFFLLFFFLFSSFLCHLGGIILISGVRICKVAISIVQYTRVVLQNAWVKNIAGCSS